MVSRREALQIGSSILAFGVTGCLGNQTPQSTPSPTSQHPTPTPEPFDPLDYFDVWHESGERFRAEGSPLEVQRSLESAADLDQECRSIASSEALQAVRDRVEDPGRLTKALTTIEDSDHEWITVVERQFIVDARDQSVEAKPNVDWDTFLHSTPRTVRVTVSYENDSVTCEHPVFVGDVVSWLG